MADLKLLFIDDSKSIHAFVKDCFASNSGVELITAYNGKVGLEILEDEGGDIDCIFLDWEMPIMNGIETLVEIKKLFPNIMVIMMTSKNGALDIQKMLSHGATDYIMKPFTRDNIFDKINEIKKKKGSH